MKSTNEDSSEEHVNIKNNVHSVKKLGSLLARWHKILTFECASKVWFMLSANKLKPPAQVQLHSLSQQCKNSNKPNKCKL